MDRVQHAQHIGLDEMLAGVCILDAMTRLDSRQNARIRDQHIDLAGMIEVLQPSCHLGTGQNIDRRSVDVGAQRPAFVCDSLKARLVAAEQAKPHPFARIALRQGFADSARRAGNDDAANHADHSNTEIHASTSSIFTDKTPRPAWQAGLDT